MADIAALKSMVQRKLAERGLSALWPAIDYIVTRETAGTWDPKIQSGVINDWGTRENSWGLFQLFIEGPEGRGLGYGHTPQELQNPERNTDIALDAIQRNLATGASINEALHPWSVTHGIDAASLVSGAIPQQQTQPAQEGGTMSNGTDLQAFYAWLAKRLLLSSAEDAELAWMDMAGSSNAIKLADEYNSQGGATTSLADVADIGNILSTVEASLIGDYERQLNAKEITFNQALQSYTADISAAIEAGRRGQDVAAIMEDRAKRATSSRYYPGLEPGGFLSQISSKWDLPQPPVLENIPAASLPDPWEAYRQGYSSVQEQIGGAPAPMQMPEPIQTSGMYGGLQTVLDEIMGRASNGSQFNLGAGYSAPPSTRPLEEQMELFRGRRGVGIGI